MTLTLIYARTVPVGTPLHEIVKRVFRSRILIYGGYLRDMISGVDPRDIDLMLLEGQEITFRDCILTIRGVVIEQDRLARYCRRGVNYAQEIMLKWTTSDGNVHEFPVDIQLVVSLANRADFLCNSLIFDPRLNHLSFVYSPYIDYLGAMKRLGLGGQSELNKVILQHIVNDILQKKLRSQVALQTHRIRKMVVNKAFSFSSRKLFNLTPEIGEGAESEWLSFEDCVEKIRMSRLGKVWLL